MRPRPKYATLAKLKAAFERGELTKADFVMLDNDSCHAYRDDGEGGRGDYLFGGKGPRELLEEALTLLGIPWENA